MGAGPELQKNLMGLSCYESDIHDCSDVVHISSAGSEQAVSLRSVGTDRSTIMKEAWTAVIGLNGLQNEYNQATE